MSLDSIKTVRGESERDVKRGPALVGSDQKIKMHAVNRTQHGPGAIRA